MKFREEPSFERVVTLTDPGSRPVSSNRRAFQPEMSVQYDFPRLGNLMFFP